MDGNEGAVTSLTNTRPKGVQGMKKEGWNREALKGSTKAFFGFDSLMPFVIREVTDGKEEKSR